LNGEGNQTQVKPIRNNQDNLRTRNKVRVPSSGNLRKHTVTGPLPQGTAPDVPPGVAEKAPVVPNESGVQNVPSRNPGSLLRTVNPPKETHSK
jgi:hypothetical protein